MCTPRFLSFSIRSDVPFNHMHPVVDNDPHERLVRPPDIGVPRWITIQTSFTSAPAISSAARSALIVPPVLTTSSMITTRSPLYTPLRYSSPFE